MSSQLQTNINAINLKTLALTKATEAIINHTELLPYIPLEYIEQTGSSALNTNITTNVAYTLELKFQYTNNINADDRLIGNPEGNGRFVIFGRYQNKFRLLWGTQSFYDQSITQDTNVHIVKINNSYVFDGRTIKTGFSGNFGEYQKYGAPKGCRIFYIKKYNSGGTLIHDAIPVIRISDGEVCMYDKVTQTYYTSPSHTFIAGPEV